MNARGADCAPSPTTRVAIATARSVKPMPVTVGSRHDGQSCCRCATSMWSSPCHTNWRCWPWPTRKSSTLFYSDSALRPCSSWPATHDCWELRLAFSASSTPGIKSWNIIRTCIAWFLKADFPLTARAGSSRVIPSFSPQSAGETVSWQVPGRAAASFRRRQAAFSRPVEECVHTAELRRAPAPVLSPSVGGLRQTPLGRPRTRSPIPGRLHSSHRHLQSPAGRDDRRAGQFPLARFGSWQQETRDGASHRRVSSAVLFSARASPGLRARIRHFGFLANRQRQHRLAICRDLLNALPPPIINASTQAQLTVEFWSCPSCGGTMVIVEHLTAAQMYVRPPPHREAA